MQTLLIPSGSRCIAAVFFVAFLVTPRNQLARISKSAGIGSRWQGRTNRSRLSLSRGDGSEKELGITLKYVEASDDNAFEPLLRAFAQKDYD